MRDSRTRYVKGSKCWGFLALVVVLFSVAEGFAQTPKRVFRFAVAGPIRSLDPQFVESNAELKLVAPLVETLVRLDPQSGEWVPGAADKIEASKDGKKITFTLKQNLYWSNGEKIRAQDFKSSLLRLLSPEVDSWVAPYLFSIKGAEEFHDGAIITSDQVAIRATNPTTLVLELSKPNPFLIGILAQPTTAPIHQKTLDKYKKDWTKPEHWVGSGPFILADQGRTEFVFQKNPHHRYASKIQLDEIRAFLVASPQEGVEYFSQHSIDQFGYRDFDVPSSALDSGGFKKELVFQPDFRSTFLRMNVTQAPLSSQKFRQALAMAIDRPLLASSVTYKGETPAYSLIPPQVKSYDPPNGYLFNDVGARIELKELGYCTQGVPNSGCKPSPVLEILVRDNETQKKIALAIANVWRRILKISSINVVSKPVDQFLNLIKEGKFAIALDEMAVEPDQVFGFLAAFRSGKSTSGVFSNKTYDQLLSEAETSVRLDDARNLYRQAEAMLMRDGGIIPLFHGTTAYLVSNVVKYYTPNIWDYHPISALTVTRTGSSGVSSPAP